MIPYNLTYHIEIQTNPQLEMMKSMILIASPSRVLSIQFVLDACTTMY